MHQVGRRNPKRRAAQRRVQQLGRQHFAADRFWGQDASSVLAAQKVVLGGAIPARRQIADLESRHHAKTSRAGATRTG